MIKHSAIATTKPEKRKEKRARMEQLKNNWNIHEILCLAYSLRQNLDAYPCVLFALLSQSEFKFHFDNLIYI